MWTSNVAHLRLWTLSAGQGNTRRRFSEVYIPRWSVARFCYCSFLSLSLHPGQDTHHTRTDFCEAMPRFWLVDFPPPSEQPLKTSIALPSCHAMPGLVSCPWATLAAEVAVVVVVVVSCLSVWLCLEKRVVVRVFCPLGCYLTPLGLCR